MATKRDDDGKMKFVSVVPLEKPGVIEFSAWTLAKWIGIWMKPWNERTFIPHLAFLDCPDARQVTWRMLILEGQAQMPIDENEIWSPMGVQVWSTRRSFGTLWMSNHCHARANEVELKRGDLPALTVEAKAIKTPDLQMAEEPEAYTP